MSLLRLASPDYLWILIPTLILMSLSLVLINKRYKNILKFFGKDAFGPIHKLKQIAVVAIGIAVALILVALSRPQAGMSRTQVKSLGVETVILVDVSQSMLAQDIKPTRLEFIKNEIAYILDSGVINRASLVAFAGSSVTLSPLTSDLSAIKVDLESLSQGSVGLQGTNITSALTKADDSFFNGGLSESEDSSVTKILLLFSDGEDNEPGAVSLARKLAKQNISVFTIAVGTEAGAPIPIINRYGQQAGYLKDKKNETVVSKLKPDFLKKLAKETKGRFYHFNYGHSGANQLIEHLKNEEARQVSSSSRVTYTEYFQVLLVLSFIISLVIYSKSFLVVLFFISVSYPEATWAFSVNTYSNFRLAEKALKNENFTKANNLYSKILVSEPENRMARLNLALTYDAMKEFKKSEKEYKYLETRGGLSFYGAFNFANSLAAQKKTDRALEYYQKALEIKPDSLKAKANIELLLLSQQQQSQDKGDGENKNQDQKANDQDGQSDSKPNKDSKDDPKDINEGETKEESEAEKDEDTDKEPSDNIPKKESSQKPGELSKEDINQILEEINRQEQKIRAKEQGSGQGRGQSLEKSW